jgi:(R,R)-butanediol dehydrogenase/meso-butanediol dehydrogenase/diacetyl reductase
VADATGAEVTDLAALASIRPRYAVETTGSEKVIEALVGAMTGCSSIALVGIGHPTRMIDPVKLVECEISLLGCHAFTDADLKDVGALLPDLSASLDPFIAQQIPLAAVPDAYARHIAQEVEGLKTIILCRND